VENVFVCCGHRLKKGIQYDRHCAYHHGEEKPGEFAITVQLLDGMFGLPAKFFPEGSPHQYATQPASVLALLRSPSS
jgi:hypothetical protein